MAAIRGRGTRIKRLAPQGAKASWPRFGAGARESSDWPRKERKLAGRDSGLGRVQQAPGPARGRAGMVAIRGWGAYSKLPAPQGAGQAWLRFGAGTRSASSRPRKGPGRHGRDSGLRRGYHATGPARGRAGMVAIRGRGARIKRLAPQGAKASWPRFRVGARTASSRPRKGPDCTPNIIEKADSGSGIRF